VHEASHPPLAPLGSRGRRAPTQEISRPEIYMTKKGERVMI